MDKISICITYHNQEEYVASSLCSALSLQFPCDYEILVGDDGSSDGTLSVLQKYQAAEPDKIKLYRRSTGTHEKLISRASANRLNLAHYATGNYIAFLDGDDFYCDKSFFNEAWYELRKDNGLVACAFNFKYLHPNGTEQIFAQQMKRGTYKASYYVANGCYTHVGAILFRNIIDKDKLRELCKINNFDDNAITIYFLQYGDIKYIDRPVYMYRQTGNSLWNCLSSIEKHLLNALDYKLISDMAPSLNKEIAKRQYCSVRQCFNQRLELRQLLGQKYGYYLSVVQNNDDQFMGLVLQWRELKWSEKFKTLCTWRKYRKLVKSS